MAKKKAVQAHVINDSCCNCRFWNRLDDSEQTPEYDVIGECRRYPPTVLGINEFTDAAMQSFPEMEAQHWCGEHHRTVN